MRKNHNILSLDQGPGAYFIKANMRNIITTRHLTFFSLLFFMLLPSVRGEDITITGRVTNSRGRGIENALVDYEIYSKHFAARSGTNGYYSITIHGTYQGEEAGFRTWPPFPNPSDGIVRIPISVPSPGDVSFSVYSLSGAKVFEKEFSNLDAGSYRVVWDGSRVAGSGTGAGFYIYALTYGGKTVSGRIVITGNKNAGSGLAYIESFNIPGYENMGATIPGILQALTTVSAEGYHSLRHTGITFTTDTVINFTLMPLDNMPYAISGDHIGKRDGTGYLPIILKGINLGSSPPGYFPGEIAYAIPGETYERWIRMMAETGFNAIRVYTLHPPVFYEKLAEYNAENPSDPLFLFQGIWLDEINDGSSADEYDLFRREQQFRESIHELIDCVHGNKSLPFRPGKAYGDYSTDISPWVAAYIIGREVSPQEIDSTNTFNSTVKDYIGYRFSVTDADPSEVFFARMLDETIQYEQTEYSSGRPVSISSWPTLDPLTHPTEIYTDEDVESIDIKVITEQGNEKLLFASYHAYPYYPDFVSDEPEYQTYYDDIGPNSYYGYIINLRNYYGDMPLVIAEFGVPSSKGNAHNSFSGMNHGDNTETEQGEMNIRLMRNILNAGCGGGFMFAWMDEWFKRTWIVQYLEAAGFKSGDEFIYTRQLWHNLASPEQNFGLIGYEQERDFPEHEYTIDGEPGSQVSITASGNNQVLKITIDTGDQVPAGDSIMVAIDTYRSDIGESVLPGEFTINNRAEFLLKSIRGRDTSTLYVTQAYDMKGLTPRFNFTDPEIQKFRSVVSDGAAWKRVEWINNGYTFSETVPGNILTGYGSAPDPAFGEGMSWNENQIIIELPWTLLHFFDPTRMSVIDGASSWDGGYHWEIEESESDGIALSVVLNGENINTLSRFTWPGWLVVPSTTEREKASLSIVRDGLSLIPDYYY